MSGITAFSQAPAQKKNITFIIEGPQILSGSYASVRIPVAAVITGWTILADTPGSAVLDVWKANGAKPTNSNSITAAAKPTLTSSAFETSSTLTGWTTAIDEGDVLTVEVESVTSCTRLTLQLEVSV